MYFALQKRLAARIRAVLAERYNLQLENIPLEIPPDLRFGEMATPIAFELARKLRKAPKVIAQEIVAALGAIEGFTGFEPARRQQQTAHVSSLRRFSDIGDAGPFPGV